MTGQRRSAEEDLQVVARAWPALTDEEVDLVLAPFPEAGARQRIAWHSDRPLSAAAIVDTTDGPVFVKRQTRRVRDPGDLRLEHEMAAVLTDGGITCPEPLATGSGDRWVADDDWLYEVTTVAPGEDRYRASHTWGRGLAVADARQLGRLLARAHRLLDRAAPEPRRVRFQRVGYDLAGAGDLGEALRADLADRPELARSLTEADVAAVEAAFAPSHAAVAAAGPLPVQATHGDPQANNVFWDGSEVAAVIDLHVAGHQPAVAELAAAVDRNALHWLEILAGDDDAWSPDVAAAIVAGYGTERPLDPAERAALVPLLALHRLDFAWSLLDHYATVEADADRAAWCRDVFLQAHPRWLGSGAGAAVADVVAEAATSPG